MRFKTFETYFFRNMFLIGYLSFLLILLKKTIFLFNPSLLLLANCFTSRTINQNINIINCLIKDISSNVFSDTLKSLIINKTTFL